MKRPIDFLAHLFRRRKEPELSAPSKKSLPPARSEALPHLDSHLPANYAKGDFIGDKYEVYGVLGMGGFGVVYLVYSHETNSVYALKTFRDEFVADKQARELFRKEAKIWVDLERHPYLVRAYWVEEISERLYIAMEYVARNQDGLNSLQDYLTHGTVDLAQSLRWAVQFCHGMEYAYSRGVRCHRDIKPSNVLIGQDKTVKISDFGLAGVLGHSRAVSGIKLNLRDASIGLSVQTAEGISFGTPTHMPPEQYTNAAACDERSDIYSFGIVLYQMATGGKPPFLAPLPTNDSEQEAARFSRAMYQLHAQASIPKLDSPLFSIINQCLEKNPDKRYENFPQLRKDLTNLLVALFPPPWPGSITHAVPTEISAEILEQYEPVLEAWEWANKGTSLKALSRYQEALRCFDRALEIDPRFAYAWNNKGLALNASGNYKEEALKCFDRAIELEPRDAFAWSNKGITLEMFGRVEEAIQCFDKAIALAPQWIGAWVNKGNTLDSLGRLEEALAHYTRALTIDPKNATVWEYKGSVLERLEFFDDAVQCYKTALQLNPKRARTWDFMGNCLRELVRPTEAISAYQKALELNPGDYDADYHKALCEDQLGRKEDAARSFEKFLRSAPRHALPQIEHARQRLQRLTQT